MTASLLGTVLVARTEMIAGILPSVVTWNEEFRFSEGRGTAVWKQVLKNKFVHLTQFASRNPRQRKQWTKELVTAANLAVEKICPDWQTEEKDRAIRNLIYKTIQTAIKKKKSPRADWLKEKACAWLQYISLSPCDRRPRPQNSRRLQSKVASQPNYSTSTSSGGRKRTSRTCCFHCYHASTAEAGTRAEVG